MFSEEITLPLVVGFPPCICLHGQHVLCGTRQPSTALFPATASKYFLASQLGGHYASLQEMKHTENILAWPRACVQTQIRQHIRNRMTVMTCSTAVSRNRLNSSTSPACAEILSEARQIFYLHDTPRPVCPVVIAGGHLVLIVNINVVPDKPRHSHTPDTYFQACILNWCLSAHEFRCWV